MYDCLYIFVMSFTSDVFFVFFCNNFYFIINVYMFVFVICLIYNYWSLFYGFVFDHLA